MASSFLRTVRCVAHVFTSSQTIANRATAFDALMRLNARQYRRHTSAVSTLGMATMALTVCAITTDGDTATQAEAKQLGMGAVVEEGEEMNARLRGGRHLLLKQRSKHEAKMQEEDQMNTHLDEYKKCREEIKSLRSRFNMYASKSTEETDGRRVKAMTFTGFLHSFVLPQFHLHSPRPDLVYSCDFVGDADGLVTYKEYYLLTHLLQIPKEHFDVAFCMFDLDGDGSVDKTEFCAVIESLLRTIDVREGKDEVPISAADTLPRFLKILFRRFSKTITAKDLEEALDALRKQILRAEFDLYATVNPLTQQQTMAVHDFALTLISCFDPEKLPPLLERVQTLSASNGVVTWDEFFTFHFTVQSCLADIKLAFELTGAEAITEADFIRAARVVSGVELPFSVVQLAFRIFDEETNGKLDPSELFKVLEMRNITQTKQKSNAGLRLANVWLCVKEGESH